MQLRFYKFFIGLFLCSFFGACQQPKQTALKNAAATTATISTTIALLPYQNFDTALLHFIKAEIIQFFNCRVTVMPVSTLPAFAYYAPRQRYKADSLLKFQTRLAANIFSVAGFTNKDISTTHASSNDWGVFGLGYCPGSACIISVYRLQKASTSYTQLKQRLAKVVLHELGHNFGMPNCNNDIHCLMHDAGGSIQQVDIEEKRLCANCTKLLNKE